jgi:hypothetical protein
VSTPPAVGQHAQEDTVSERAAMRARQHGFDL